MSPVAIADRSKMSLIAMRRGVNRAVGRLKALVTVLPTMPGRAERLVIAPQDLRTADPTRASEIYSGRFAFAGKIVVCDGHSPFEMIEPSDDWGEELLGFSWLRHLRAADAAITRANARALVDEWITLQGRWSTAAWRSEVVTRRIISWLSQAPLILDDADVRFYRRLMRSLTRQVRYLRSTAGDTQDGVPRLQARIALVYASLCMAGQVRHLRKATRQLVYELERQILPDGGHATRNPGALIDVLIDLLPLAQAYSSRNVAPPTALLNAIDRMMPMLRFFRHGDGNFALFNGMGPTPPDLLATLIAYDDIGGAPVQNAVHSGYQRIEAGQSLVLMDTGRPPPFELSAEAHAGCLSFEFSTKGQRMVVNCGLPAHNKDDWREIARATPAHSTVTFNDTSSCRFLDSGRRTVGAPIVGGPTRVTVNRDREDGGEVVRTSHDGYASRYGVVHQRALYISSDGLSLEGEDIFLPSKGDALPSKVNDLFAIRFHLHPLVRATKIADGRGAMLILPNKDVWNFSAHDDAVEIEDGAFLGGPDGPRRTFQLVIYGEARKQPHIRWSFTYATPAGGGSYARRPRGYEPELPL
jgi:uncharacterized heparinase superfamily protein